MHSVVSVARFFFFFSFLQYSCRVVPLVFLYSVNKHVFSVFDCSMCRGFSLYTHIHVRKDNFPLDKISQICTQISQVRK